MEKSTVVGKCMFVAVNLVVAVTFFVIGDDFAYVLIGGFLIAEVVLVWLTAGRKDKRTEEDKSGT